MGRPKKYGEPLRVRTCRFKESVDERLSLLPNASDFIQQAVEEKLELYDDVALQAELVMEKARLRELEEIALVKKRSIDQKESTLQRRSLKRAGSQEIRLKYVAHLTKMDDSQLRNWLSSRVDVMAECGFKDIEEAMHWVSDKKKEAKQ